NDKGIHTIKNIFSDIQPKPIDADLLKVMYSRLKGWNENNIPRPSERGRSVVEAWHYEEALEDQVEEYTNMIEDCEIWNDVIHASDVGIGYRDLDSSDLYGVVRELADGNFISISEAVCGSSELPSQYGLNTKLPGPQEHSVIELQDQPGVVLDTRLL